jgi:hypothetical protein
MAHRGDYPALEADLEIVKRTLEPSFKRADAAALRFQRLFRLSELTLIFGAVAATTLGAIAASSASAPGPAGGTGNLWGVTETFLTFALGALAFVVQRLHWHERWLRQRTVAETLRGEQFLFLGRAGPYGDTGDSARLLEARILDIEKQGVKFDE